MSKGVVLATISGSLFGEMPLEPMSYSLTRYDAGAMKWLTGAYRLSPPGFAYPANGWSAGSKDVWVTLPTDPLAESGKSSIPGSPFRIATNRRLASGVIARLLG